MKRTMPCRNTDACLNCDNSKFSSLVRGNVPLDCKKQFFAKHITFVRNTAQGMNGIINTNLTNSLLGHNNSMKSSAHHLGEKVLSGEAKW